MDITAEDVRVTMIHILSTAAVANAVMLCIASSISSSSYSHSFHFLNSFYNIIKSSRALLVLLAIPYESSSILFAFTKPRSLSLSFPQKKCSQPFVISEYYRPVGVSFNKEKDKAGERDKEKKLRRINYNPIFCTIILLY